MPCAGNGFGLVFAMTNAQDNGVSVFARNSLGDLTWVGQYETGGSGSGEPLLDPLSSQGALAVSGNGHFLFAVNAGDNTVSSFRIRRQSLELLSVCTSGGVRPVGLATSGDALYVINAGDESTNSCVAGLWIDPCGGLCPIAGSRQPLSEAHAQPACVAISPCARALVVTERSTGILSTYTVADDGSLTGPNAQPSSGAGPFGATFRFDGVLFVAEGVRSALSSYDLAEGGVLSVISGSVQNGQEATCWVSITPDGRNAYTSNAGSGTISRYELLNNGSLVVLGSETSTPDGMGAPLDSVIDRLGRNLYVLNGNQGSISVFDITQSGDIVLRQLFTDTGLPTLSAQGLAIR